MARFKKRKRNVKKTILTIFAVLLIAFGAYLTTTTGFKILHGYALYKFMPTEETLVAHTLSGKGESEPVLASTINPEVSEWQPKIGEVMGKLTIPTLNSSWPIIHGTGDEELDRGVGHFDGSVLPGENDNSVLSGHNNTVFHHLGDVGEGDEIIVETKSGVFTYQVHTVRIVDEDDRTVIVSTDDAQLTLTTCYPFHVVGFAPERYVLVADLVDSHFNQSLALFTE